MTRRRATRQVLQISAQIYPWQMQAPLLLLWLREVDVCRFLYMFDGILVILILWFVFAARHERHIRSNGSHWTIWPSGEFQWPHDLCKNPTQSAFQSQFYWLKIRAMQFHAVIQSSYLLICKTPSLSCYLNM